ncbi:uncharacterized protein BDW47DRAFT_117546 [Aspergillus candidus]|uniref:F-box domain-containing protein n=1 Tax=Aspergillus candidus TaxID=41067 RepID=A0A2I2FBL9_ASPCN|nr:hypothetical protein BDW47DRAFT_117546 [Aspergillus candidus]PLB38031.1 hypothetical protein BDW47DRAFT_117546 [Aspergillus candidus]
MALPLNLIATIISHVDDQGDLARICRTCRVLNYMALPELYRHMILTSYDRIRYRDEQPEGMGSASPFTMGLNAVITRPFATLELEEHARVGRVPDASMLLNVAVRAAVDRMTDLESFSWELSTKMLETVYQGLAQRPRLQSLTLRFPSSRHPRPTIVIPAMPHLRHLKVTDIDPLCYPDDISTLLFHCRKLRELKMHWSPRMRNAQEPSVKLHDYFRKCITARRPLALKKLGLQNLYALHSEEFNLAFDPSTCEDVTILSNTGSESPYFMNTFVDSTWPTAPPNTRLRIKSVRQDNTSRRHVEFLRSFTGLERLYFVSATGAQDTDHVNNPRRPARLTEEGLAQTDGATSQSQSQSQTPTGTAPPTNSTTPEDGRATTASPDSRGAAHPGDSKLSIPRPQPPSLLGKRQREDEHVWAGDPATDTDSPIICMPPILPTADGRLWRRQVKRVGWETLRRWEIWGLDTQEL